MIYRPKSPARVVPVFVSLFVSVFVPVGFLAACGEPADATLVASETHALAAAGEASDGQEGAEQEGAGDEGSWLSRCETNGECSIGQCVCGVCTESCNGESDACSGSPQGATCFGGRSLPRAALCHATTVPGICLQSCNADDECGDGLVCALGACLPEPSE